MTTTVEVFTSPTCPHCPHAIKMAKEMAKELDYIRVFELSTATPSGQKKARKYGIMSVPTLIIKGPAVEVPIGLRGTPSRNSFIKAVETAEGLRELEEEENISLWERIKRIFV